MDRLRSTRPEKTLHQCCRCPRLTTELRLDMCIGCYLREKRGTALPEGAACSCGAHNPIVLVFVDGKVTCYNCRALGRALVA